VFCVEICDGNVETVFSTPNPILALDLALRAIRAGFSWRVLHEPTESVLTVEGLRTLAHQHAAGHAAGLDQLSRIAEQNAQSAVARLN
jgi:hypothetical protein